MVDEACDPTFPGGINDALLVDPEEVAGALVLQFLPGLVLDLSFISNPEPHDFTDVLNNLKIHNKFASNADDAQKTASDFRYVHMESRIFFFFLLGNGESDGLNHHGSARDELRCVEAKRMDARLVDYQMLPALHFSVAGVFFLLWERTW